MMAACRLSIWVCSDYSVPRNNCVKGINKLYKACQHMGSMDDLINIMHPLIIQSNDKNLHMCLIISYCKIIPNITCIENSR